MFHSQFQRTLRPNIPQQIPLHGAPHRFSRENNLFRVTENFQNVEHTSSMESLIATPSYTFTDPTCESLGVQSTTSYVNSSTQGYLNESADVGVSYWGSPPYPSQKFYHNATPYKDQTLWYGAVGTTHTDQSSLSGVMPFSTQVTNWSDTSNALSAQVTNWSDTSNVLSSAWRCTYGPHDNRGDDAGLGSINDSHSPHQIQDTSCNYLSNRMTMPLLYDLPLSQDNTHQTKMSDWVTGNNSHSSGQNMCTSDSIPQNYKDKPEQQNDGNFPLTCPLCSRIIKGRHRLQLHLNTHKKPTSSRVQCVTCGKTYSSRWTLRTHERLHTGERPYNCSLCSSSFSDGAVYRRHMKSHANLYYACQQCNAVYKHKQNLTNHEQKIHATPQKQPSLL